MKAFILAGGGGTRLWPLSRALYPKQFLKIFGRYSLFQKTLKRLSGICSPSDMVVLTNKRHKVLVEKDLQEMDTKDQLPHVLIEPEMRNTAPAIALGIKYCLDVLNVAEDEVVFVTPSDHIIEPLESFFSLVKKAEVVSKAGYVVTFGIKPNKPETGYGYIKIKDPIPNFLDTMSVERFVEKPDYETAKKYLDTGLYLWNSGMFCFTIRTIMEEFKRFFPRIYEFFTLNFSQFQEKFPELPNISIDYAVMERSDKIATIMGQLTWNDVGSWDAIYEILKKDPNGNVAPPNTFTVNSKGNLIIGDKRLIASVSIQDTIIVDSEDAILLVKKGESQKVRDIVEVLQKQNRIEADAHKEEFRPWGSFRELFQGPGFKVKHIKVYPKARLSLQKHKHRAEHWVVVKGKGKITVGDRVLELEPDQDVYIPKEEIHRMECISEEPLEVIEVQLGDYLGEDDIIRLEDVYGRV